MLYNKCVLTNATYLASVQVGNLQSPTTFCLDSYVDRYVNGLLGCRTRTSYVSMLKNYNSPVEFSIDKQIQFLIAP